MKLRYEWFGGDRFMFWFSIICIIIWVIGFVITYIVNPVALTVYKKHDADTTRIAEISAEYLDDLRGHN